MLLLPPTDPLHYDELYPTLKRPPYLAVNLSRFVVSLSNFRVRATSVGTLHPLRALIVNPVNLLTHVRHPRPIRRVPNAATIAIKNSTSDDTPSTTHPPKGKPQKPRYKPHKDGKNYHLVCTPSPHGT